MSRRQTFPSSPHHHPMFVVLISTLFFMLPRISLAWWGDADGAASAPRKIKPRVTRPSGPTNVQLFVVSRSELGVKWEPPLFDGGEAISKYLIEWDTDKSMPNVIASPSNPYSNSVDGPLVRSEVVSSEVTDYRIAGLVEGQKYYVRVSAYGDGYSPAISSAPLYAIPAGVLPGFLTRVSLTVASDSGTADRLRLAWSAPVFDTNGFGVLPAGCAGSTSPPSLPDSLTAYRVTWDTHPSLSSAFVYDIPVVSGDGFPQLCCPADSDDDDGACNIELGVEVQSITIMYPQSTVPLGGDLFDTGAVRIVYVGSQSKSIKVDLPSHGSNEVRISPSDTLPIICPVATGDLIRIQNNVYVISNVDNWPEFINISSGYIASKLDQSDADQAQAYFTTPPQSCFDVSNLGNSAESFRAHLTLNFDDSPFDETIAVSRSTLSEPYDNDESGETRVVGYTYHVTFSGQGFSSTLGSPVDELFLVSTPECGVPFVSNGVDVSSKVSVDVFTEMDSGSIIPGRKYYVKVAGVNNNGAGPFAPAVPVSETPRSLPGLAQNCRVYAVPTASSSLKVEWDGVYPNNGLSPSSYRVDFYDMDGGLSDPVKSHVVTDIHELTKYSITKKGLVPGKKYKVNVVAVNELGEGGPIWFSDFNPIGSIHDVTHHSPAQDYIQRSCNAVPTCDKESVQCAEELPDYFSIVARSVPPPPKFEVGTFPNASSKNRFSKDSVLVTFESPSNFNTAKSIGVPADKFLVEWSTSSSFEPSTAVGLTSLWSSEVNAQYADEEGQYAMGELLLESLTMGTKYYVRVSAHNTAGYGAKAESIPMKPMTRPDPAFEPILSRVTNDYLATIKANMDLSDSAIIGTSLLIMWQPPRIDSSNDRPDLVGDGGDLVTSYLVEWSRVPWDNYSPSVYEIYLRTASGALGSDTIGLLSGSFQVVIDTSATVETALMGSYVSAMISADESTSNLKIILENIPNVGEVEVTSPEPFTWRITFLSELGDFGMTVVENQVFDDDMVAGIAGVTKVSAAIIPANSAYGFEVIRDISDHIFDGAIHYFIRHLVPGMKIYVRVSSGNQVGFGPRRKTAPEYSSPALQRPDIPTSLYSEDVPPYLSVYSPSALKVHIGPPFYDGGSPLTSFFIEWDTSPSFDSSLLGDGSSLGSARADATSRVCTSCVNSFDVMTNTLTYAGSEMTAKLLIPQRRISVHFHDDNESYTFSVVSATASMIAVSTQHLRMTLLDNMRGSDGNLGSNLELLGTTFVIGGLTSGQLYHVRVSSENGEMGTGKSIQTLPSKETPRGFPLPPSVASVSVVDKTTLNISWSSDAHMKDPNILAFKVECFCKDGTASSSSYSFYGEQEVVKFSTSGLGIVGGTFRLHFGELGDSTNIFLSTASAWNGLSYIETKHDLSPHLNRGETLRIGEKQYTVHETRPFTSTILPLADTFSGANGREVSVFALPKTVPIAFDATSEEFRNAVEQLPYVNHVEVRREIDDNNDNGYAWYVTFISNVGPQPAFTVDTSNLVGLNPIGFAITRTALGIPPADYYVTIIQDPTVTSFDVKNLSTGKPYYTRVSSISDRGESVPIDSVPAEISPGGVPGKMAAPTIRPINETTLLVSFAASAENNGALIEQYFVETSSNTSFSENPRIVVQPNHKFQRITTRAHSIPWNHNSSFTLSLGDFHGDFTVAVGDGSTTVRVQNGDNVLERSSGTASLSAVVPRGDFVSVGGVEFRICLSSYYPHDDSHIALCSKDNAFKPANYHSNSAVNVVDELPIFILDTSLGASKSPTLGDTFLSTVDAFGLSKDMRPRLRRGDMIRVGHPESGETFRVSIDPERAFTDRVIPLSSVDDAATAASLSSKSLHHATYEVQSFFIRSSSDATTLTPSGILSSGYRIRFKSETSQRTITAGSGGCLKWDGDAYDIKVELESMLGIDAVDVTREDLAPVVDGAGAGVMYFITFTGSNVGGNVPPLQIVDVGSNGCLDARLLGGKFGGDIAPIEVEQVEISYVPLYDIQTTADIPYDASSADMKAALESLSQACTVSVSRQIDRHGFSWDITFVENEGSSYSPLLALSANGANLSADIDPGVSVVDIQHVMVTTPYGGTPVFARVAAVNSFGIGPSTLSNPRAAEASAQPPSEPVFVFAEAISNTEILVQWNPPVDNGGRSITHYKIEYDYLPSFTGGQNSGPSGSISVSSSMMGSVSDVQSLTVKIDNDGLLGNEVLYLSGTFSLSFDGQKTSQLPFNASPEEVKAALEALCNVNEVTVKRSIHCSPESSIGCMSPEGYTWLIMFVSLYQQGDQHYRHNSKLASRLSHKLSADGSYLFECSDVSRTTCIIGGRAVANVGTVQEVQEIEIATSPFSVTIGGETSEVINLGDSLIEVERKLNSYSRIGIGKISVTCASCIEDAIGSGDTVLLYFASYRGDLPLVIVSDPFAVVRELVKGSSQFVVGRASYSTVISGLSSVHDWYVRVFAYNGVGEGQPELAWPYPLRLSAAAPQTPQNIGVSVLGSTSLEVTWDRPSSIGAADLSAFIVQYDTSFSFSTRNGMPLGQMKVSEADVDASIAVVSRSFPNSRDPVLRRRIIIDDVDSISQGDIGPGSILTIDGRQLTVSSVNEDNCGVTCLTMNQDYVGSNTSGVKIYLGLDPRHYVLSVKDLIPGVTYFVRVAASNEHSVGPFSFDSYPFIPASAIPMDVPSVVSWAAVSSIASNALRIDFAHPREKPFGVNGSPTSKLHLEIATGVDEVQKIMVTSTTMNNPSFSLVFDGVKTSCIPFGASARSIEQALETLTTIDDVLVTRSARSSLLLEYDVMFVGSTIAKRDQPLLEFASSSTCRDNDIEISILSVQDGVESFRPEIIALSTMADDKVSGFIELSVGYHGEYSKIVSVGNQPAQFMVDAGSRVVSTMGDDLTSVLHTGETFVIGQEIMEVRDVRPNEILVKDYHIHGTSGAAVSGYRMNNYIGSATISPGGNSLVETNGLSLEAALRSGEVIEVFVDDAGGKVYLTVISVDASSVSFSPRFSGSISETPIYARTSAILPASSSSALMQSTIESLLHTRGLVEVSRDGPNSSEGYTWFITFHSNIGLSSCSHPSLCLAASTEVVAYISVDGLGQEYDGDYIQSGFNDGMPRFELFGQSRHVSYDFASSEWRLYDGAGSVVSFSSSTDTSVPLSGWTNGVVISPPSGTAPLLLGKSAEADVSILQHAARQSFEDSTLLYSEEIFAGKREVQEVKLLSDEDDIHGSFELSFGAISQNIIIYSNESTEDFETKLQSLSGVGRVSVESIHPPESDGRAWLITFLSNSGDVPLLKHHGIADLIGSSITLSIQEKVKGTHGENHIVVGGLDAGKTYAARISAENEAGLGLSTDQILGAYPMARSVSLPPEAPVLELGIVTKSRANVEYTEPSSNGSDILSYKFEWTTSSSFNSVARANVRVFCSDGSLVWGSIQFIYGNESGSKTETTVPIDIRSNAVEISRIISAYTLLREVEVITVTNNTSELAWDISFLHNVGPIGQLSVDLEYIQCESEGLLIDSSVVMTAGGSIPSNYGSIEISTDYTLCGSVHLGEFSAVQYLTLVASSDAVTAGSYQLSLDGEASVCIPFDASESQVKNSLEALEGVGEVQVTSNAAHIGSQFPYEYTILLNGNYAYGDWPALQVNSFGDGECDPFVGGVDHRATILPIRDESLCRNGADNTVAIVADSMTTVGGTFDIYYGQELATDVSVNTSASELREILAQLISPDVIVSRHDHDDIGEGVAWAVTYPGHLPPIDHFRVVDTFVTGRNAKVDAYPIIIIESFSPENDSSGDFRIVIDGESTAPISYRASQAKILHEIHRLKGIGKVSMLGPTNGNVISSVNLSALVDDDFVTEDGLKAIAVIGDFTSSFAPGDKLMVGTCELGVKMVAHYDFDESKSAGQLYHTHYSTSIETAKARVQGFSVLQLHHTANALNFANDCSQANGASVMIRAGSYLDTGKGAVHSMIIKTFTAELNDLAIVPERNWRGTAPRIFFKRPSGIAPLTFTLEGIEDEENYIVRASARNSHGFGPPSAPMGIVLASTVPGAPRAVLLL